MPSVLNESQATAEMFRRRFAGWDRWGLSAFCARSELEVDDLAANRLRKFELIRVYNIADLAVARFQVVPTFRSLHVTIAWTGSLLEGLQRFDKAKDQSKIVVGRYVVGGMSGSSAVVRIVDVAPDGLVRVLPVEGSVEDNRHLLGAQPSST